VNGELVNTLVLNSGVDTVYTSDANDDGRNDFFVPAGSFGFVESGQSSSMIGFP
jgi:hypothetical protein